MLIYIIMAKLRPLWMLLEESGITPEMIYEHSVERGSTQFKSLEDCVEQLVKNGGLKKTKKPHSLVTLSLPKEEYQKDFSDEIKKCINRNQSMMNNNDYIFNLEFYGKKSDEIHPHAHILIKGGGMDKSKIIRAFSRHFKIQKNFIDIQRSEDEVLYLKRLDYIKGIKKDEKMEYVQKDEEFREKHGILKYYESI